MPTQLRHDRTQLQRVKRTDDGYLTGESIVTRTGVFEYLNEDGTIRRELRHPDDVFDEASLETLRMLPMTDLHPDEEVNSENVDRLGVGTTGENYKIDGTTIRIPINVTHKRGIDSVDAGRRQLSLGYRVRIEEMPGEYNGQPYDVRQRDIRYNHLALVDRARAGDQARINLDGIAVQSNPPQEANAMTVKVTLDGIQYDAAPEVEKALARKDQQRADAEKNYEDAKAKVDTLQAQLDEAKEDLEKEKKDRKKDGERLDAAVAERVELLSDARMVLDSVDASTPARDLMVSVIQSKHDGLDLTDRSDEYIRARFDAVMESVKADKAGSANRASAEQDRADNAAPTVKHSTRGDAATLDYLVKRGRGEKVEG